MTANAEDSPLSASDLAMMRYFEGAMSPQEEHAFLAAHPAAQAAAERWRAQERALRGAFDPVLNEPAPERLLLAAQMQRPQTQRSNILAFRLPAARPRWETLALAAAAALVLGLQLGRAFEPATGAIIRADAGDFIARGALERALNTAPSGAEGRFARILLTVPAQDGGHCRAFSVGDQSGLACRGAEKDAWRVVALAEQPPGLQGDYRPASGPPEAVLAAIEAYRAGDPLEAAEENALIRRTWR